MITLDDVTLTFPDGDRRVTAVDHVSLTASAGVVTGITGPSGSGKSSLLAVAATLIRPDSGRVLVSGADGSGVDAARLSRREAAELRRDRIGIVFQQSNLLPSLTATEQLLVMGHLGGGRRRVDRGRVFDLLDAVGLSEHADKRPAQLSGGQRQRVAIARALVNEPDVLLVDEPTSALDQERGGAVMDLIAQLTHERGTATLLVTHDLVHRRTLDRLVTVLDGQLVPEAADAAVHAA
ncbi:putative ABC transport system ATP-binding protein [Curtobacterium luteum]|uniref:ABC transport system ATP-binding protein n=1 Tax=Curtobacterium luteum TaxID=33881 RepID=A0A8H9GA54_9MICO|nr:ABC transporter ATP-binding protein [Curtobacterium luteum]MBM7802504.1 putative ABC transport system ATP-binding protein [Curtobacterium luteum]NUU50433.1 ABC transporter ATP-binding protein [Curtobacterium luteum]GGL07391.1 ABC transporter ATP-binding protein [Curtobacterium luteum]